ncbi:MAG: AMMECR1 domain-containing protein, partial [Smithella sp.]|nr:AMMECR1 domain-containing protein [Smithella sp.]
MELTDKEKNTLLDIAKNTIAAEMNRGETPRLNIDSETLKQKRGAFVTLKKGGQLRGCIGYIKAYKPLW